MPPPYNLELLLVESISYDMADMLLFRKLVLRLALALSFKYFLKSSSMRFLTKSGVVALYVADLEDATLLR